MPWKHRKTERQRDSVPLDSCNTGLHTSRGHDLVDLPLRLRDQLPAGKVWLLSQASAGWPQWAGPLPHEYVISKGFVGLLVFCSVKLFFLVWLFVSLWTVRSSVNFPKRQLDLS